MLGKFCVRINNLTNHKYKIDPKGPLRGKSQTKIKYQMTKQAENKYDLEDRNFQFAKDIRDLIQSIYKSTANVEYCKQLARASASVGANYIEANEALSKKDFLMRIKISRKEIRESKFFLGLLDINEQECDRKRNKLINEAEELRRIFSAILNNARDSNTKRFDG